MVVACSTWDQKVACSIPRRCQKTDVMHICKYLPSLSCLLCYVYARLLFLFVLLVYGIE